MNGPMGVGGKVQGLSHAGSIESVVVFEAIDTWEGQTREGLIEPVQLQVRNLFRHLLRDLLLRLYVQRSSRRHAVEGRALEPATTRGEVEEC